MSHLEDRLGPVPPLDEVGRHRLERAVMGALAAERPVASAPAARRWSPGLAAVAAAAAVGLAVAGWLALRGGPASTGAVPAHFAAAASAFTTTWADARLVLAPGGAMTATGDAVHGAVIVLERGTLDVEVEPRGERPPFTVVAGDVRVEVVGTRFRVARHAESATVEVTEGVVRVVRDGGIDRVEAGSQWDRRGRTALAPSAPPPAAARPVTGHEPEAPPAIATATEPAPVATPATRPPSRRATTPAQREPRATAVPDLSPAAEPPAAPSARFGEAARLEPRDPDAAMAIYRELAARADGWGANAQFALGRLAADRGQRAAAIRHLRAYLARFPSGANAPDARTLLRMLEP
jgi:hypothetical protein